MCDRTTIEKEPLIEEIERAYSAKKNEIISRLNDFKEVWKKGNDEDIFTELIFCILTPQSKAESCSRAVKKIICNKLFLKGNSNQITNELSGVRFKNRKAKYIVEARNLLTTNGKISIKSKIEQLRNARKARDWLVQNIKGLGYKEASHFLRNIGHGEDLAILDRHILKNLKSLRAIEKVPNSLQKKRYFEIENWMIEFSNRIEIPIAHLDLLFWSKETGKIFK